MFPSIKKKEQENRTDIIVEQGKFSIYFLRYSYLIQWVADVIIGCFFVLGSILNFLEYDVIYTNISYFIGSLAMTVRPIIKVYRHIQIKRNREKA